MATQTAELVAGPELDAQVHRLFFPRHNVEASDGGYIYCEGLHERAAGCEYRPVPPYSTDIAAAWEVFNRWPEEYRFICWRQGSWEVHLTKLIAGQKHGDFRSSREADTAPLAICRAALAAVTSPPR